MIRLLLDGFEVGRIEGFTLQEKQWDDDVDLKIIKGKIKRVVKDRFYGDYFAMARKQEFRIEETIPTEKGYLIRKFLRVKLSKNGEPIRVDSELENLDWDAEEIDFRTKQAMGEKRALKSDKPTKMYETMKKRISKKSVSKKKRIGR